MFAKLVQRLLEKDLISVSDVRGAMDDALHELSSYGPEVFEQGRRSIRHALVSMRIESDD